LLPFESESIGGGERVIEKGLKKTVVKIESAYRRPTVGNFKVGNGRFLMPKGGASRRRLGTAKTSTNVGSLISSNQKHFTSSLWGVTKQGSYVVEGLPDHRLGRSGQMWAMYE